MDCWQSNNRTRVESSTFKDKLIKFYECAAAGDQVKCMATGNTYPRHEVRASHIIKRSTNGETLELFGLPPGIDEARNGMLLLQPIEMAFDRKDICFLYDPYATKLILKVLNPELLAAMMTSEGYPIKTYGTYRTIDGTALHLPTGKFPYRRALSMHAKFSFSRALHMKWIQETEDLKSYFDVSDGAGAEPLGLGELSWKDIHTQIHTNAPLFVSESSR